MAMAMAMEMDASLPEVVAPTPIQAEPEIRALPNQVLHNHSISMAWARYTHYAKVSK